MSPSAPGAAATGQPQAAGEAPVPREVLRQVRLIELRTRGVVDTVFSGEYHSVFKGQGMEFAEVRQYLPGDDVRSIDWNVTARTGEPYVKKYVEERELTVLLLVDLSGSEQFGTRGRLKAELAAELTAVLALSAVGNNDRVGLLVFTDHVEHFVPPKKGRRHVLRLIRDVLAFRPSGRGTDISAALDYAGRLLSHRSIIFLLSDFQRAGETFKRSLKIVSRHHDVVPVRITDPREEELPDLGLLALLDPETGEEVVLNSGSGRLRDEYRALAAKEALELQRVFRRFGIDHVEVRTDRPYVVPLLDFFRRRERLRAR